MLVKCESNIGIIRNGIKIKKGDILEINNLEELGQYAYAFNQLIEDIKIEKKSRKGGNKK